MSSYSVSDLIYQGEEGGVHNWQTLAGSSFYWHPDWLHIAEEMTGHSATANVEPEGEKATTEDAQKAIVKHLNNKK